MVSNRPLVFLDLDDTLFQTPGKMPEDACRYPASHNVEGAVSGYQSEAQKTLLDWLRRDCDLVPVTARSVEAFGRVALGFSGGAICAHGGVILGPDGEVDLHWQGAMAERLRPFHARLPMLCEAALQAGAELGMSLRGWVLEEGGQRHCIVIKHNAGTDAQLVRLRDNLLIAGHLEGLYTHLNGNNLALLPLDVSKRAAVAHYLAQDHALHGSRLLLGIGDSVSDLGFMGLCHFWATPSGSQVAQCVEGIAHA